MTMLTKVLVALLLVVGLLAGVQTWRVRAAQHDTVEAALAPARQQAAIAAAKVETVTVKLAAAERVVTRTINSVRIDTLLIHPRSAQDTARALAQLPALATAHESLQRSCSAFVVSCGEFRLAAQQQRAADSTLISRQDAALRDRPPRRHWTLGLTVGYGALLERAATRAWEVHTGPSLTAGLTWTPF